MCMNKAINNYLRLLCFSPLDFSFATCLLPGLKWEGIREFLTRGSLILTFFMSWVNPI